MYFKKNEKKENSSSFLSDNKFLHIVSKFFFTVHSSQFTVQNSQIHANTGIYKYIQIHNWLQLHAVALALLPKKNNAIQFKNLKYGADR